MRAIFIYEAMNFKRGLDPRKAMNIGMHPKHKTKSWKILDFIKSFGKEGVRYSDIQKFIYFELNKAPLGFDYFSNEPQTTREIEMNLPRRLRGRGYWGTELYGTRENKGLLRSYCYKNDKGKWVFNRYPERHENIF